MRFESPLEAVTLLKRYKRFLADVRRADGSLLTVHVPNSGSMKTCVGDDWPALISDSGNPSRKYRHTLEMVHNGTCWIGVNTSRANALALEALTSGAIPGFADWDDWRGEVRYGENSRIDLLARRGELLCYVEVKN
ncbi:MAG: DNA/RNA nuclease SfsA, partial [Candidatus Cloacimonetes bacterium]|nr:DNA/RNA nuclease SfsA [Candidatus Cloacimonadota bacterium]